MKTLARMGLAIKNSLL
jgi:transposase